MIPKVLNFQSDYKNIYFLGKESKLDYRGNIILATLEMATTIERKQKIFVEIGTFKGYIAKVVLHCLNKLQCYSKFYSIDINLPFWEPGKGLCGWTPKDEWHKFCSEFLNSNICIPEFIEGDANVKLLEFEDESIIWCLIDGCHCYHCALSDINNTINKVCQNGLIIIDDTINWDRTYSQWYHDKKNPRSFGVDKAIKDSNLFNKCELIHNANFHHGVQVWRKV